MGVDVIAAAVPFSRSGFRVLDATGRSVGVIVHDSRSLHAAACRLCGAGTHDRSSWTATVLWLAHHLGAGHVDLETGELLPGVHGLALDAGRRPRDWRLVRITTEVDAALSTARRRKVA